jgi:hypothetical protein
MVYQTNQCFLELPNGILTVFTASTPFVIGTVTVTQGNLVITDFLCQNQTTLQFTVPPDPANGNLRFSAMFHVPFGNSVEVVTQVTRYRFFQRARSLTGNPTCDILLPTAASPGPIDQFGLGNVTEAVATTTLDCLYDVPNLKLDRTGGVISASPQNLIILDVNNICTREMRIRFQGIMYQVLTFAKVSNLVEVQLGPIGGEFV